MFSASPPCASLLRHMHNRAGKLAVGLPLSTGRLALLHTRQKLPPPAKTPKCTLVPIIKPSSVFRLSRASDLYPATTVPASSLLKSKFALLKPAESSENDLGSSSSSSSRMRFCETDDANAAFVESTVKSIASETVDHPQIADVVPGPFSVGTALARNLKICMHLSKSRLAMFVTLTAVAGYGMSPGPLSLTTLVAVSVGTALCAASANSFNQLFESPFDAQMQRTRARPLVRHLWRPATAAGFAAAIGATGVVTLALGASPIAALLGGANIFLYALVYTPSKRLTIANTWIGAVVGAVPPVLGWAASCTGWAMVFPCDAGALVLGYLLYAWQFPHFAALSWGLRGDYARAGYHMMATTRPMLNARVALTYSLQLLLVFPLASIACGIVTPAFFVTAGGVNLCLVARAYQFWRSQSHGNARRLFFATLLYLPAILAVMIIHRKERPLKSEATLPLLLPVAATREQQPSLSDAVPGRPTRVPATSVF